MTTLQLSALFLFAVINFFAFGLMAWDKRQARRTGAERISEGLLFFLAILFGSLGVFLGMFVFRHKTRTIYFLVGIPVAFIQNVVCILTLAEYINVLR